MSSTTTPVIGQLRQHMIEDMNARQLGRHCQRGHIASCKRFAGYLKRSPDTATADDVRLFQLHLIESGASICNRNRVMTGMRFLFRVTLRRHDLAAEIYHIKEPLKLPLVLSPDEVKRILAMAPSFKARVMLTIAYGCGLRANEVVRLRVCDIESPQMIIRIVQSKGCTATSCCRPRCWHCCANGGRSAQSVTTPAFDKSNGPPRGRANHHPPAQRAVP
jgi:integrase/recombinase XerD